MKKLLAGLLALGFIATANAEVYKITKFTKAQKSEVKEESDINEGSTPFATNKGVLWIDNESSAIKMLKKSKVGECYNITDMHGLGTTKAQKVNCSANGTSKKMTQKQIDVCIDKWTNAYRKEAGADALVRMDMLDEWEAWCKAGKQP